MDLIRRTPPLTEGTCWFVTAGGMHLTLTLCTFSILLSEKRKASPQSRRSPEVVKHLNRLQLLLWANKTHRTKNRSNRSLWQVQLRTHDLRSYKQSSHFFLYTYRLEKKIMGGTMLSEKFPGKVDQKSSTSRCLEHTLY